jgi:hypothetical protein
MTNGTLFSEPPGFTAVTFTAQTRIIDLHETVQTARRLAIGHCLHQFVLHTPGRAVTDAQMAHQLQRRDIVLGLGEQVQRQKPGRQRQLGAGKDRVRGQTGLMTTGPTLPESFAVPVRASAVTSPGAARTDKARRPTRLAQRSRATHFRAELFQKRCQRHPRLHLNRIHRHDRGLHMSVWPSASLARVAVAATRAELWNESGKLKPR